MNGKRVAIGGAAVVDCVENATKNGVTGMVAWRLAATGRAFEVTWTHI